MRVGNSGGGRWWQQEQCGGGGGGKDQLMGLNRLSRFGHMRAATSHGHRPMHYLGSSKLAAFAVAFRISL